MIEILTRNIHGQWSTKSCNNRQEAYDFCLENTREVIEPLEALAIFMDGKTLYSSLMAEGITWEELTGWFA